MSLYLPEGFLIKSEENKKALGNFENFKEAFKKGTPLEARALTCDKELFHALSVPSELTKVPQEILQLLQGLINQ